MRKDGLRLEWNVAKTKEVLVAAFPFYVNAIAVTIYLKIDINLMGIMTNDKEVRVVRLGGELRVDCSSVGAALYCSGGAATGSRAAARSNALSSSRWSEGRSSSSRCSPFSISLIMAAGADIFVPWVFGAAFLPAINALRILALMFVLTYVATLLSTALILLRRSWTVTAVGTGSLVINGLLNFFLLRWGMRHFGEGGAGATAAAISVATELLVAMAFLLIAGRRVLDGKLVLTIVKAIAACAIALAVDIAIHSWGAVRLVIDGSVYTLIVLVTGAFRLSTLRTVRNVE